MRIGDWSADVCSSDLAARVGLAQHARRRARHAQGSARLCAAARLVRRASASVRMKELTHVEIATDGACKGNPGSGGWGAVIRAGTREKDLSGGAEPRRAACRERVCKYVENSVVAVSIKK